MEEEKEEKKQTKFLEPFETAVRMGTETGREFLAEYERNHKESNQDREDGWISDLPRNLARAGEEGIKKFKLSKILDLY